MVLAPGLALEQPTPPLCSLKRLGESGSDVAAVVFGCYGSRQRVLGWARLECGPLESGDASVLPHNVGLLELELDGAQDGEDDAGRLLCAGIKGSSTVLCREG